MFSAEIKRDIERCTRSHAFVYKRGSFFLLYRAVCLGTHGPGPHTSKDRKVGLYKGKEKPPRKRASA